MLTTSPRYNARVPHGSASAPFKDERNAFRAPLGEPVDVPGGSGERRASGAEAGRHR